MIELLLLISLSVNGWLFHEKGEIEQSNTQIKQQLKESTELVDTYYAEAKSTEAAFIEAQKQLKKLNQVAIQRSIELEELRNTNASVRDYLQSTIPIELVQRYQTTGNYHRIQDIENTRKSFKSAPTADIAINQRGIP